MGTKFQQKMWRLASYDPFIMQYCPVMYTKVAGIGVFFIFQLLVVFSSVFTAYKVFVSSYNIIGLLIGIMATILFYKWIKFLNNLVHEKSKKEIYAFLFIINICLAIALSTPYCLLIFDHQILFQLFTSTGKMTFGSLEGLWLLPYGLYKSWLVENEGNIILFICFTFFLLLSIILNTPYFLIHKNKKSSYILIKQNYERNF